ncbi:glycosyltransferase family 2 protein [Mangrovivirga sp. M17]|uniref:Glycosyltransferase family 2 protein n=1 Tax=Mangrovivirga halotolerans TaxID=2993936 RepID=A0ABT3RNM0_9BACT|nr:glycosyltransferase family 2 protein [Mangrovivirga halotolerans]MCX2743399.1 glycosyltransferase family 2 protein [Mangrovivirga halotolerans]
MLVSIITPFYNSEKFLLESIQSVLNQEYDNWELILVNDGSTDRSKEIALSFIDPRIKYFEQSNRGVASARNVGLKVMSGDYFCFLDADDVFTPNSLASRLKIFKENPDLAFVDGVGIKTDLNLNEIDQFNPSFRGNPFKELVQLTGSCFFGQTWLIKRDPNHTYEFNSELTHSEDLLFFMELSKNGGLYDFTDEKIFFYRTSPKSAMSNLEGLEHGYRFVYNEIKNWPEVSPEDLKIYNYRYRRAMFLAYLRKLQLLNAFSVVIK